MGERKGQNKYYPPDFDYKVHKSLAGYHGQHPLRERARKLDRGILIIRFEMPYNIWCDGCNAHIGMGVRYNAEKSKIGMYYTTPIYQFRMKCHLCNNHFEIKTDPGNHDYVITTGARRKEQRWDPHENEQIVPEDRATQKKLALDSMYKLEHGVDDVTRGKATESSIAEIVSQRLNHKDDHILNQLARKQFRDAKKAKMAADGKDEAIKTKFSLNIDLVKEHEQDVHMAELLRYSTVKSYDEKQKEKRREIEERPLFGASVDTSILGTGSSSALASGTASIAATPHSSSSGSSGDIVPEKQACITHLRHLSASRQKRKRSEAFHSTISSNTEFSDNSAQNVKPVASGEHATSSNSFAIKKLCGADIGIRVKKHSSTALNSSPHVLKSAQTVIANANVPSMVTDLLASNLRRLEREEPVKTSAPGCLSHDKVGNTIVNETVNTALVQNEDIYCKQSFSDEDSGKEWNLSKPEEDTVSAAVVGSTSSCEGGALSALMCSYDDSSSSSVDGHS